jgi:hypothetical protein
MPACRPVLETSAPIWGKAAINVAQSSHRGGGMVQHCYALERAYVVQWPPQQHLTRFIHVLRHSMCLADRTDIFLVCTLYDVCLRDGNY